MESQCQRIVKYMQDFGSITSLQAMADLGCMRLASRISDLRREGVPIERRMIEVTNRYGEKCRVAEYKLTEDMKNA